MNAPSNTLPTMEILGVYRPFISKRAYREQWKVTASDAATEEHFRGLVLIEALLHDATEPPKMIEIGQECQRDPIHRFPPHFQVPYDEALLSLDGKRILQRKMNCVQGFGILRFAFYLHFYDQSRPLTTPFGELICPPIETVPWRLRRLVPYRACT